MKRFVHALKHEAMAQSRYLPSVVAAVAGSVLLITAVTWLFSPDAPSFWSQFPPLFIIVGVILTSATFGELRSEPGRIEFLLRPTTQAEKTGAKLLVSLVGYWIVFVVVWAVGAFLARAGYALLFHVPWSDAASPLIGTAQEAAGRGPWVHDVPMSKLVFSNSPLELVVRALLAFIPLHAVFFFGSVYFGKKAFGRTLLSLVVWGLSYFIIGAFLVRLTFAPYWMAGGAFPVSENQIKEIIPQFLMHPARLKTIGDVLVAAIFYLLAWRRLAETEG